MNHTVVSCKSTSRDHEQWLVGEASGVYVCVTVSGLKPFFLSITDKMGGDVSVDKAMALACKVNPGVSVGGRSGG
jgi:hypothetical protein